MKKPQKEVKVGELNAEEQARKTIKEAQKKRAEACGKELDLICKKYNCILVPNADVIINGQRLGIVVKAN